MTTEESELFAICWTHAQPTVAAFVSALVPNFHQAEDVLDQVSLTLVRKFGDYDRSRPFENWAIGVARFEVLKHYERHASDRLQFFSEEIVNLVGADFRAMSEELDDRRQALQDCLKLSSGRSLAALQLRYLDDLKPQAIAKSMKLAESAVRVLLHRARAALKKCIERRLSELEGSR